jgi:hypothetical protein
VRLEKISQLLAGNAEQATANCADQKAPECWLSVCVKSIAVGALIRYSQAEVGFDDPDIGKQAVKAGGIEVVGGVRVRFWPPAA